MFPMEKTKRHKTTLQTTPIQHQPVFRPHLLKGLPRIDCDRAQSLFVLYISDPRGCQWPFGAFRLISLTLGGFWQRVEGQPVQDTVELGTRWILGSQPSKAVIPLHNINCSIRVCGVRDAAAIILIHHPPWEQVTRGLEPPGIIYRTTL